MQIKTFNILAGDVAAESELNRFLNTNRIIDVQQAFYQTPSGACFAFCVRYTAGNNAAPESNAFSHRVKKDYRNELPAEQFAVFARLRELRKQIAAKYAVQAYMVFTDEELASIARLPEIDARKLISIHGIGDKKVEKYGKELVEMYLLSIQNEPLPAAEDSGLAGDLPL